MTQPKFSIIICTRNRADLLKECLNSLKSNEFQSCDFEVLVIDNGSEDSTKQVFESFENYFTQLLYFFEAKVGLSVARNRGIREAKSDWLVFLDDDAKATPGFLSRFYFLIQNFEFSGIGGIFKPWFSQKSVTWIPKAVIESPVYLNETGPLPNEISVPGGICAFSKEWLKRVGLFPENLGMRGEVVGYGEENYVQDKIRSLGGEIWFDPNWEILHYVAPYKYEISWHVKRLKGKGRDYQIREGKLSFLQKFFLFIKASLAGVFLALKNLHKLIFNKSYPWQSWLLDSFSFTLISYGRLRL